MLKDELPKIVTESVPGPKAMEMIKRREEAVPSAMIENSGTYGQVIRFLAPLVMTDEQLEAGLKIFEEAIKKCM